MYFSEDIAKAVEKFLDGSASEEDRRIVDAWYYSFNDEEVIINSEDAKIRQRIKNRMKSRLNQMLEEEKNSIPGNKKTYYIRNSWRLVAAAVIFLLVGVSIFKFYALSHQNKNGSPDVSLLSVNDVAAPVSSNAILTLADGSTISLESAMKGAVALQGNTRIIKEADGEFTYNELGTGSEMMYNTLSVPNGSKVVTLKLSDGTQVWINSGSSLRYPVSYNKNELKVFIKGEAYFEVSKNPGRKFLVASDSIITEVLGTHFNINAYADDEVVKVTLLEGSLKVTNADAQKIIIPGQQADLLFKGPVKVHKNVDVEEVMAWKNGLFKFNKEDLKSIMHKIERWYNVEVSYKGNIKNLTFGGAIPRKENVSSVLELLEMTGVVKFSINASTYGKAGKITVKM